MTIQIGDIYKLQSKEYCIIDWTVPLPFTPNGYGLEAHSSCTACWRGYWCTYTSANGSLVLKDLYLFNKDGNYPTLNGKCISPQKMVEHLRRSKDGKRSEPILRPAYYGHRVYEDVNLPLYYNGKILIGRNHTDTYYINGLWNNPWKYKDLVELLFEDGVLVKIIDQSEAAKDIRKIIRTMARSKPESHGTMGTFVQVDLGVLDLITNRAWWLKKRG